jgi:hypothetical protein
VTVYRYVEPSGYTEDFDVDDRDAAVAYAQHMLRDGDWGDGLAEPTFVHATVTELDGGGQPGAWHAKITVELEPTKAGNRRVRAD